MELVAVPLGFVTDTGPVVAPVGTVVVILVSEFTVNMADTPLNFTSVAPVKFVPVMAAEVPTGPMIGLNSTMTGAPGEVTVKLMALVAVPPGVVTDTGPVVAPAGTVVVTWASEFTVKTADTPLNVTVVAPVRLVPVSVTEVPTGPLIGLNARMTGAPGEVTVKLITLVALPSESVMAIGPVVAPDGTVAVIWMLESTVKAAAVPLKVTAVATLASSKPFPVMMTEVPTGPVIGLNSKTTGAAAWAEVAPSRGTSRDARNRPIDARVPPRRTPPSPCMEPRAGTRRARADGLSKAQTAAPASVGRTSDQIVRGRCGTSTRATAIPQRRG